MKRAALGLLRGYKRWISPMFPPSCRYVPTCSEYAMEAVERYGAWRGGAMAAWRVLRCHPLAKGGLDAVVKDAVGNPTPSASLRAGSCAKNAQGWAPAAESTASLCSAGRTNASVPTCNV
jgi:putative membrane protein insertion efficiency factor